MTKREPVTAGKPTPGALVQGGQGHDPEDISRCAWGCFGFAVFLVTLLVLAGVTGLLGVVGAP